MTLIRGARRQRIAELTDLHCRENNRLQLEGVERIRVREERGPWRQYAVSGRVNLLESCDLQGRPGEYEIELDSHPMTLSVSLAHFTPAQVDEMVEVLHEQEYRYDARAHGDQQARRFTRLEDDVLAFTRAWHELCKVVSRIVLRPAEHLTLQVAEVGLRERQRHTASTLNLNLRTGRLTAHGTPTRESVYALSDLVSLDTAENSHLLSVVQAYEERRAVLQQRARRQIRSLQREFQREQDYQGAASWQDHMQLALAQTQGFLEALSALPDIPLPATWRTLRHKPSASTNWARFDERYAQLSDLEGQLDQQRKLSGRPDNALQVLQECGRRATWQLYEYWLVAKLCEQLCGSASVRGLGFEFESPAGLLDLEDWQGASYGFKENHALHFRHGSGLRLELAYEGHVPWAEDGRECILRPDVTLRFVNLPGESVPLVLDAKYKNLTPGHPALSRDLEKSARRYGQALGGAMAFLVHPGQAAKHWQYWPARGPVETPGVASEVDFPLQHGVLTAFPGGEGEEDVRALRRVLTAWFVRYGIYWVCFRCGENLARFQVRETSVKSGRLKAIIRIGERQGQLMNYGYCCPVCSMTAVISYCAHCNEQGHHRVIYKYSPHLEPGDDASRARVTDSWSQQMELMQPVQQAERYYARHCAACGSDFIPGEAKSRSTKRAESSTAAR